MTTRISRFAGVLGALLTLAAAAPLSAQLGAIPAEQWATILESGRRLSSLELDEVVARLKLQDGDVVADIGAGTGIFSVPMARAVGERGRVLAVEVDAGFLPLIEAKAREAGMTNVAAVLGEYQDPKLPRPDVNVAFFHDVLHHIEDRPTYIRNLAAYMAPGGRVVVVDYHRDHPGNPHRNEPALTVSLEEVTSWMTAAGFRLTESFDLFEEKFFVVYSRE